MQRKFLNRKGGIGKIPCPDTQKEEIAQNNWRGPGNKMRSV